MYFYVLHRNSRSQPKWRRTNFGGKWTYDSATGPQAENATKISLSSTISEILKIFYFNCYPKILRCPQKMAWEKRESFGENGPITLHVPYILKFGRNHSILHHFWDVCIFAVHSEIHNDLQQWWDNDVFKKRADAFADTLGVNNSVEIILCLTVSKIETFSPFTQKCNMATKNGWRMMEKWADVFKLIKQTL